MNEETKSKIGRIAKSVNLGAGIGFGLGALTGLACLIDNLHLQGRYFGESSFSEYGSHALYVAGGSILLGLLASLFYDLGNRRENSQLENSLN